MPDSFFAQIDAQLDMIERERPKSFAHLKAILEDRSFDRIRAEVERNGVRHFDDHTTFFAGSGGDRHIAETLYLAGWHNIDYTAEYELVLSAPNLDRVQYLEGDLILTN